MAMDNVQELNFAYLQEQGGIQILTGEACRLSMRLLCDINEHGRELLTQYFGLPYNASFQESWNCTYTAGSIMLTRQTLNDLAIFHALVFDKADVVAVLKSGEAIAFKGEEAQESYVRYMDLWRSQGALERTFSLRGNTPGIGGNATHAMSGRTQ